MLNNIKLNKDNPLFLIYFVVSFLPLFGGVFQQESFSVFMGWFFVVCALASVFFILKRKEDKRHFIVVCFMFIVAFSYLFIRQGGVYWNIIWAIPVLMSALVCFKFVSIENAIVISIFLMSLISHSVPAIYTDMIEEIDPYYHYKWGNQIYEEGIMPEWDFKTYPKDGGISRSNMPFSNPLAMAVLGKILFFAGYGFHEAAVLFPALMAGLSCVIAFFMIKEIFKGKKMVTAAATFAVFALMFSLAWSTKAHATDCEDEAFGGFMLFSTIFMYFLAINRKSIWVAILGAFVFGALAVAWDGHRLITLVVGLSIAMYSIFGVFNKKRAFYLLKYYAIMFIGGNFLWRIVLHEAPYGFNMSLPHGIEFAAISLAIISVIINEFILTGFNGLLDTKKKKVFVLVGVSFVVAVFIIPNAWYYFYKVGFVDVGQSSVVFKTIAEQNPFASSISQYLSRISLVLGPAAILTIIAIIPMFIYSFKKMDFGTMFFICWAAPMLWGLYFKSQYMFLASLPVVLASSFVVIFLDREEFNIGEFYVIPLVLVVSVGLMYTPIGYYVIGYDTNMIFFNVASYDRIGWENALQYLATTPENTAILTWWDYGHWITAVSKRHVLIDNLQRDHWQIQDVARFFMMETDEEDAFSIVDGFQDAYYIEPLASVYNEPVGLDYVAIDWTMVGKSGAMRFIATGNLTTQEDGDYGTYTQCSFSPQYSNTDGVPVADLSGKFEVVKTLVFPCTQNKDGLAGVIFDLTKDELRTSVMTINNERIAWDVWAKSKDASLMGIRPIDQIFGVSLQYKDRLNIIPPTYKTIVYASGDFENFMLARMYFAKYIDNYKEIGLADVEWSGVSDYYEEYKEFDDGYVRILKIKNRRDNDVSI